ncbi:MAG: hydrogenase formation protein HypD [Planctomycetaceae bacterium]|nr:hydrogenase formation protein HypD [Planctomycetaceae bacterium]
MKYLSEYRDPVLAQSLVDRIRKVSSQQWTIMEVCGGQTHALLRTGIDEALSECVELIHGPGCPVCVTPAASIQNAIRLSMRPGIIVTSFGDMLRVPGEHGSLLDAQAQKGNIKTVYSPMDAVQLARQNPEKEVVFLAVGFETTAPATAIAVLQASQLKVTNFSILCSHVCVLPAMKLLAGSKQNRVQGFLAAGHVCTLTGFEEYADFVEQFQVPVAVTGFEPTDLLAGILEVVTQLELQQVNLVNCYPRAAKLNGNQSARELCEQVFDVTDRRWRGMQIIPDGGLCLKPEWSRFDAEIKFSLPAETQQECSTDCRSGEVLAGMIKPPECSAFGTRCTPQAPLGAPMVSTEGACAAYYRYRNHSSLQSIETT